MIVVVFENCNYQCHFYFHRFSYLLGLFNCWVSREHFDFKFFHTLSFNYLALLLSDYMLYALLFSHSMLTLLCHWTDCWLICV